MEILPAIMPDTYADFEEKAGKVKGLVYFAQIDIMDGAFVPSRSWPYVEDGAVEEEIRLPFRKELQYEVDLMVADPYRAALAWIRAGVSRILFHVESVADPKRFIESLLVEHSGALEVGVAIGLETSNDVLEYCLYDIDVVQFMGIARIGYQKEPFDERVLTKIAQLRQKHPETIISVDGGVNFETAPRLMRAGATRLVSGSAIYTAQNIAEAIQKFQKI